MSISIYGAKLIHNHCKVFTERKNLNEHDEDFLKIFKEMIETGKVSYVDDGIWIDCKDFWVQLLFDEQKKEFRIEFGCGGA